MLADTTDQGQRPSIDESYATSASTSNLKVEAHRRTPADMVIAAGMNRHTTGLALMRLQAEWDRSAKPKPLLAAQIEAMAAAMETEGGLVREEVNGQVRHRLPLVVAQEQAARWHEHELKILLQGLKTLPRARELLSEWLEAQDVDGAEHVVGRVLVWWLAPTCPVCRGVGERVVKGTHRLSGRACGTCRGKGKLKLGGSGWDRRVLGYINECLMSARVDFGNKFRRDRQDRRGAVEPVEMCVRVGERWRARDGKLWDFLEADNPPGPAREQQKAGYKAMTARLAPNHGTTALYKVTGRAWGVVRSGQRADDLIEPVGPAP